MKTKFLSITLLTLSLIGLSLFFSCSETKESENKPNVSKTNIEKLLGERYNLTKTDIKTININKLKFNKAESDFSQAELYKIENSGENFLIIPDKINCNNYTLLKFKETKNDYEVAKQLSVKVNIDCDGNGTIEVINISENVSFTSIFVNGKLIDEATSKSTNNSSKGLCQRESGETFKQCFNRESDEFCDDFISTVAYYTNVSIPVLIAGLCTC